jgi:hypothetical protein
MSKIMILENTILGQENKVRDESNLKEKEIEERKRLEKAEE